MKLPVLLLVVLVLPLSGCMDETGGTADPETSSSDPTGSNARASDDRPDTGVTQDADQAPDGPIADVETTIVAGTLTWHSTDTQGVAMPVTLLSQPVFNECASGDGNIGIGNLDLRKGATSERVPNGTHTLTVRFSWETTDYPKDRLVLAYAPEGQAVRESDWIQNGQEGTIGVNGEPNGGQWGLWACVSREGATTNTDSTEGPKPFLGDLTFEVVAVSSSA